MAASPRKRRPMLSMADLKRRLSAGIEYATKLLEDEEADHDLRLRGFTALIQAAATYTKVIELYEVERDVQALQRLSDPHRNGHQPP